MSAHQRFARRFDECIANEIQTYTSSFHVCAYHNGEKRVDLKRGKAFKYYDWASLTKIVFTTSVSMDLYQAGILELDRPVCDVLAWWPHKRTRIKNLLNHTSGLHWWRPYYKKIVEVRGGLDPREKLQNLLAREKLNRGNKAVYSDLGMFLYGFVLEELTGQSLIQLWERRRKKMGLTRTHFNVSNRPKFSRRDYAPTEECPWRKRRLQGEVHDDNAWSFGGVATNSGLFGPMVDLAKWGLLLREGYARTSGSVLGRQATVKRFTRRSLPRQRGDWGLGFMKPTMGRASCGRHFAASSFGHTGFTGTSLWYDPTVDLLILILSNRVHPSRKNKKFVKLRPIIHDIIYESL